MIKLRPLRLTLAVSLLSVLACARLAPAAADEARRPNVVVILTDDQGWGDLSLHGNRNLETPHIDSLARDGASFDRFFVCPVCSPTRAEFLTGRYHPRGGVFSTSAGGERMDLDEHTIAEAFQAAGYATAAFGKWHNGMQYPYHPNGRGFDEYYGFCSGHWGNYFSPPLEHNGQIVQGDGFVIDDFTNHAMQFIEQHRDQPFFVYLPYNTPHSPMQVPDRWWNRFRDKELTMRHREPEREDELHLRAALAMCENIDWNVGRLLQKLAELKLEDDTIVVFFHDNGPNGSRWNGGMKGRKGSTDEGGVRSPLLIRWPAQIPAGREVLQIAGAIDLFPTLTDLASVSDDAHKPWDGVSLKPLLRDRDPDWPERMIFSHWNKKVSVRTQQYRLDHQGQLYDLQKDPGQYRDLSAERPEVTARLSASVQQWKDEVLSELDRGERPFILTHPDYRFTQMPARDARPHGGLKRSNRFPNCSFFSNWTSREDKLTWPVEALAAGNYRVDIHYACPAADVGSTVEVRFGDAAVQGRIAAAHDPPLRGAEHDRSPRQESFVKDFRSLTLGTLPITPGSGELTLQAVEIPGAQALEFRLLMLTRVE